MKVLGAGDNVFDRYATLRTQFPGGNAVNVAVFAARLGVPAAYFGRVGSDDLGSALRDYLQAEGVDVTMLRVVEGRTATADVDLVGNDRVFIRSDKGVALFEPSEADLQAMADFDVVHAGYAGSLRPHIHAMAARTLVSFDFGARYDFAETLQFARHLHLASYSAGDRTDEEARRMVVQAVDAGAKYALATRGAAGSVFASSDGVHTQPAHPVRVVDTLGAGDAFIACLLVGLLRGEDIRSTLPAAAANAAHACFEHGAFGYGRPYAPE